MSLPLGVGEAPGKLKPMTETGGGEVQDKIRALLSEIVAKVTDLFDGELTDDDRLVYVNNVLRGKLLESDVLMQQAMNHTKNQFAQSPDLNAALVSAIMDAFAANTSMSTQALNSTRVQSGLKDILLGRRSCMRHCGHVAEVAEVAEVEVQSIE